jgi:predicted HicB family RNase H-like nuclease
MMAYYKGYTAEIKPDLQRHILHGRVLHIQDVIAFEGETPEQAEQEFYQSIEDYLTFCEKIDRQPEKPISSSADI